MSGGPLSWRLYGWAALGLGLGVLLFVPAVDLTVSGWFYDAATGSFPARTQPFPEWIRQDMPRQMFALLGIVLAIWVTGFWVGERIFAVSHRVVLYLLSSLAIGPGVLVNLLLKEHWGRPRPSQIMEFGGTATYVPPFWISDQCSSNCSFSSGHGSLGFWVVAVALLVPGRWRPAAVGVALLWGALVSGVRIAQGGHFLSDVIVSAIITCGVAWGVHRLFFPLSRKNNHFSASHTL